MVTSLTEETQSQYETGMGVDGYKVGAGEAVTVKERGGVAVGFSACVSTAFIVIDDCVNIASIV